MDCWPRSIPVNKTWCARQESSAPLSEIEHTLPICCGQLSGCFDFKEGVVLYFNGTENVSSILALQGQS